MKLNDLLTLRTSGIKVFYVYNCTDKSRGSVQGKEPVNRRKFRVENKSMSTMYASKPWTLITYYDPDPHP